MEKDKNNFQDKIRQMLKEGEADDYVMVAFFIDRFQLISTFYGADEGDRMLAYIEKTLRRIEEKENGFTYGKVGVDVFCFAMEYKQKAVEKVVADIKEVMESFDAEYDVEPNFGLYVIKDIGMPVDMMYNNASAAAKKCAGNYLQYFSYYTDEMDRQLKKEQEILNEMHGALEGEEFQVYLQPKYNIHSNLIVGAEALVRWMHPEKGVVSPGEFIPVFERNGFITKLDFYVWEQTCKILKNWIDLGHAPKPISVNLSRANLYLSKLVENITKLVDKYGIPHQLLEFEITEGTYAMEPAALIRVTEGLRANGFVIAMDDFGTGYSSLNILKDIEIDILKLDMQFMVDSKDSSRGQNILASMLRMAKWLKIPVIVEGVETQEQIDFLKSVGCEYVQGFYFAKPMPITEYEELCDKEYMARDNVKGSEEYDYDIDLLFQSNPQMQLLFGDLLQPLAVFEFDGMNMEMVRVNEAYFDMFGADDNAVRMGRPIELVGDQYKETVLNAFVRATAKKGTSYCEFIRYLADGTTCWIGLKLRYVKELGGKHVIMGIFDDITAQKQIDFELFRYRRVVSGESSEEKIMLIVDDEYENRRQLMEVFGQDYHILQASDGAEALKVLEEEADVSIILLDLIMPEIDGWSFLRHRKEDDDLMGIPVIVLSEKINRRDQEEAMNLGVSDYIVRPFVAEIVKKRVNNAIDAVTLMKETMKKVVNASRFVQIDQLTGLYKKDSALLVIEEYLKDFSDEKNALLLFHIDELPQQSRRYAQLYQDSLLRKIGEILRDTFRQDDICFRLDSNTICAFARNFKAISKLKKRLAEFGELFLADNKSGSLELTYNIGAVYTPECGETINQLLDNARNALQKSTLAGKNKCCVYFVAEDREEIK